MQRFRLKGYLCARRRVNKTLPLTNSRQSLDMIHPNDTQGSTPVILTIDTTANQTNIAVWRGTELLCSEVDNSGRGEHAARLAPMVEKTLADLRQQGLVLSAVALSAGPGSYTGLRIASSFAKGLCQGLSIPLIAISTLEAMAHSYAQQLTERGEVLEPNARLCPMLDARRMEVYTATFSPSLERLEPDNARVLTADKPYAKDMQETIYHFVGSGAEKCRSLWQDYSYHITNDLAPLSSAMGALALRAYETEAFVDLAYWTPNYLKEYVAVVAKNKVLNR